MKGFFVYVFLDENEEVLYVGKTINLKLRLNHQHFCISAPQHGLVTKKSLLEVNKILYVEFYSYREMMNSERYLIKTLTPKLNTIQNTSNPYLNNIRYIWKEFDFDFVKFKKKVLANHNNNMKIISIANLKGGVGKTTSCINLGAALAQKGFKTLLIDFGWCKNLSIGLKINKENSYNVSNFINGDIENFKLIEKESNLFILPGSREILNNDYKINELSKILYEFRALNFKYILIDCASSDLIEIALKASDYVISPIEAEEFSIDGMNNLIKLTKSNQFLGFYFNKVVENTLGFRTYRRTAKIEANEFLFKNYIRKDKNIERAKKIGESVFANFSKSNSAEDFEKLTNEILKKIE